MPSTQFSSAFQESVRWLLALHDVMSAGRSESSEANELRVRREKPWYQMVDAEQELIDGLSADLYTIGQPREISNLVADRDAAKFEQLINEKNWVSALEFLRSHESQLPPDDVACIRGICWASLGQPTVADRFFLDALRLNPSRDDLDHAYRRFLSDHRPPQAVAEPTRATSGLIGDISRSIVHDYATMN
jgi:hypothetical protein